MILSVLLAVLAGSLGLALAVPLTRLTEHHARVPVGPLPAAAGTSTAFTVLMWTRHDWSGGPAPPGAVLGALALTAVGVVLARVDLAAFRLPDRLVLPAFAAVPLLAHGGGAAALGRAAAGAGLAFAAYGLLHAAAPPALGFGDVKLAALLAAALASLSWSALAPAVIAATVLGCAHAAVRRRRVIPYGPALLAGAFAAVVAGR